MKRTPSRLGTGATLLCAALMTGGCAAPDEPGRDERGRDGSASAAAGSAAAGSGAAGSGAAGSGAAGSGAAVSDAIGGPVRIATYNIEDIRTADVESADNPRLIEAAKIIQRLDADILLVNEVTFDVPGVAGDGGRPAGSNASLLVEHYIGRVWEEGLDPIEYTAWMPPTNTGVASGFDLDNDGAAVADVPPVAGSDSLGVPPRQTPLERAYGNDAWGFGTFPGQYGMALFVKPGLDIQLDGVQTFQTFRWSALADANVPVEPSGQLWYSDEEWASMRLSSKNHAVIPVEVPGIGVIKIVASHPTPPAFDGEEMRNRKRNHDEIKLVARIIDADPDVVSDQGGPASISAADAFVVVGDLNADPDEGSSFGNPIETHLLSHPRIRSADAPEAVEATRSWYPDLDPDDTARWGLRVDYVLPSVHLAVVGQGVVRTDPGAPVQVSDHFPVFIDVVAAPGAR